MFLLILRKFFCYKVYKYKSLMTKKKLFSLAPNSTESPKKQGCQCLKKKIFSKFLCGF